MSPVPEQYVLKIHCPDVVGIVAAVAGFLADSGYFIVESSHFGDALTDQFFMRTVFTSGDKAPTRASFEAGFGAIAEKFGMTWSLHDSRVKKRVMIMVSKADHCLLDLLYRHGKGELNMEIPAIVSNHMHLANIADAHNIPYFHIPVTQDTKQEAEARLLDLIEETQTETVVLARYMQVLSDETCRKLSGRAINIHHSFLPGFKGARPYHQAHARGVKLIGATAHYVTADLDEGPIIEQMVERVNHSKTPEQLITIGRNTEARTLSRALGYHLEDRVFLNGSKTVVFD
ncbi:formyltetrahydrofolate deformylase [Kordiimonas marina]|uniref:formyltetrahydrofolate deformylase n=1 Tax=Kordiimonas marina TaxID=2872312 RepID=UPI001FF31818|nr:formyltetrahydrofolate deformylase [Kordiimonas marina]MCJ9429631.1 formyltetrahydrofolate deformylase [Kordiimonas marina]